MEEAQRSKLLEGFKILNMQFDESVAKARADLQSGRKLEDLMAGAIAEFAQAESGYLASVIVARLLREAKKPVRKTRQTAVVAKRARIKQGVSDVVE